MRLTEKQTALLQELADVYPTGQVLVSGRYSDHSLRTAKSLEEKGWLTLEENHGDFYASFTTDNYADWHELMGSSEDQPEEQFDD
ncbi:MAG: hypothetical protein WC284_18240 [Candidimonas sp.]